MRASSVLEQRDYMPAAKGALDGVLATWPEAAMVAETAALTTLICRTTPAGLWSCGNRDTPCDLPDWAFRRPCYPPNRPVGGAHGTCRSEASEPFHARCESGP